MRRAGAFLHACAAPFLIASCALIASLAAAYAAPAPRLKPPAPAPSAYISVEDFERLRDVRQALMQRKWPIARAIAWSVEDPTARALAQWMYLTQDHPLLTLEDADGFLTAYPDWPQTGRIQILAERIQASAAPGAKWLVYAAARPPRTGEGKFALARAHFDAGNEVEGEKCLREAWIDHDLKLMDQQRLLASYGRRLRPEDHAARVDRLLWGNQRTATRRILDRTDARTQRIANVRMLLLARADSALTAYNALPEDLKREPALLYELVRYLRRQGDEEASRAVLRSAPSDHAVLGRPDLWWSERRYQAREALQFGFFEDAYAFAAGHGYSEGAEFAEAEWLAGWIALRFLEQPGRATAHFDAMNKAVSLPISKARAHYWLGRAADAAGWPEAFIQYRLASNYPTTFYGQMAAEALKADVAPPKPLLEQELAPSDDVAQKFEARPWVKALHILGELGDARRYRTFTRHFDDALAERDEFVLLARMGAQYGLLDATVRAAKTAAFAGHFLPESSYPVLGLPSNTPATVDVALILGLSRQESEFNVRAVSRAGARGLMQLMPETARQTARKAGLPYRTSWLLNDPVYNLEVGSAHLAQLLERFGGSYIMTIAAYNAGAGRVDRWINEYGDPRRNDVDPIDWIELIPFNETRNYVQRVLENTQVYRARLGDGAIEWRLASDLTRGGRAGRAGAVSPPSPVLAELARKNLPKRAPLPDYSVAQAAGVPAARAGAQTREPAAPAPQTAPAPEPPAPAKSSKPQPQPLPPLPDEGLQRERAAQRGDAGDPTKTAPKDPIFEGAYESARCAIFIPDSTGGGTCIEEKPAGAADTAAQQADGCAVFIPDATGGGTCADPDVVGEGGGILPSILRSGGEILSGDVEEGDEDPVEDQADAEAECADDGSDSENGAC